MMPSAVRLHSLWSDIFTLLCATGLDELNLFKPGLPPHDFCHFIYTVVEDFGLEVVTGCAGDSGNGVV
jgi:hypothetical protein